MRELLAWVKNTYNVGKIYITENGFVDGEFEDDTRILYLQVIHFILKQTKYANNISVCRVTLAISEMRWN